jgi:hypothetical protein
MSTPPGSYDSLQAMDQATQSVVPLTAPASGAADQPSSIITQLPAVNFDPNSVAIHTGFYVTNDDTLVWNVHSSVTGLQCAVAAELLRPDGTVARFLEPFTTVGDRLDHTFTVQLVEGFLISANVGALQTGIKRGMVFVDLGIQRPGELPQVRPIQLCAGYVISSYDFGWPSSANREPTEGQGLLRSVTVANPGAGADWLATVPIGARWRLNSVAGLLTTSAAAGTRYPRLLIDDGVNLLVRVDAGMGQGPGGSQLYSFAEGFPAQTTADGNNLAPLPANNRLMEGWRVLMTTQGILGGDQWSQIALAVEEWLEPSPTG